MSILPKHELEVKLKHENNLVMSGVLREENPLDISEEFNEFLEACRRGDLKRCQELISAGVNINGRDSFDYTPLIVASLCGHFDLVRFLLESGAVAERNTFQGERCIYNALNDKIRKLLIQYDYSKSTDPLQPWSSHVTSLLSLETPRTADITLAGEAGSFGLHKFFLSARTPYFRRKLEKSPDTTTWKLNSSIPIESYHITFRYLYLSEPPKSFNPTGPTAPTGSASDEKRLLAMFKGIDKVSRSLEVERVSDAILDSGDRRLQRQRYQDEVHKAQAQLEAFLCENILDKKLVVETRKAQDVKWSADNSIFADCLLQADEPGSGEEDLQEEEEEEEERQDEEQDASQASGSRSIPVGSLKDAEKPQRRKRLSSMYPVHKAMLIRSPYFLTMFSGPFMEAQESEYLRVIKVDCAPAVLEVVLMFLYTEKADCTLDLALDLLYTADMLLLDKLKSKAAGIISALGSGNVDKSRGPGTTNSNGNGKGTATAAAAPGQKEAQEAKGKTTTEAEPINVYDVIRAAWDLRVQRLEEFAARYIAERLEDYIDEAEFADLIKESASRLRNREETDTIELLDDIRYYLSERFRLRFEDAGWEEMLDEKQQQQQEQRQTEPGVTDEKAPWREGEVGESVAPLQSDGVSSNGANGTGGGDNKGDEDRAIADPTVPESDWIRTLDGKMVEDEFEADAANYQTLLDKIDDMLVRLKLDA